MAEPAPYVTPEEYLRRERAAELKSEYVNGQVYAMAGASPNHSRLTVNLTALLWTQLRAGPCSVFNNDMKVRVDETGLHAYPDLSGLCGTPEFADDEKDVLLNPALIIEVLSPSTESYDRGAKFHHYQRLASLRQYVLVSQEAMRVELYTRQGFGEWLYRDFTGPEEVLPLGSVGAELRLAEIYERVELSGTGEA